MVRLLCNPDREEPDMEFDYTGWTDEDFLNQFGPVDTGNEVVS